MKKISEKFKTILDVVCEYDDFCICKNKFNGLLYVLEKSNENTVIKEVIEVYRIDNWEEIQNEDICDILNMCDEDYDYSGELDNLSSYCFWRIIEEVN